MSINFDNRFGAKKIIIEKSKKKRVARRAIYRQIHGANGHLRFDFRGDFHRGLFKPQQLFFGFRRVRRIIRRQHNA